jgi:hypothetical protein
VHPSQLAFLRYLLIVNQTWQSKIHHEMMFPLKPPFLGIFNCHVQLLIVATGIPHILFGEITILLRTLVDYSAFEE